MRSSAARKGYRTRIALGAELELIPAVEGRGRVTAQDADNMVARAAELAREPGVYATDQFDNPYVIPGHREQLGREIWDQTGGAVTAYCHGIGTAGSLMGISEALKKRRGNVRIVALEPAGSAAITGGPQGSFAMQGWTGLVPPHWDADRVDDVWPIEDDAAIAMTLRLAREEGIFAGISTGANVVAAMRLADELPQDALVVTLAVDSGFKYMGGPPYA